jgi:transposase-like protein
MEKRKRRSFSRQYKAEVVERIRKSGKSIGAVARELDLAETAVRHWVRQAEIDSGRGIERECCVDRLSPRGPSSRRRANEIPLHRGGEVPLPDSPAVPLPCGFKIRLLRLAKACSERGTRVAALFYSLIESAKLDGDLRLSDVRRPWYFRGTIGVTILSIAGESAP